MREEFIEDMWEREFNKMYLEEVFGKSVDGEKVMEEILRGKILKDMFDISEEEIDNYVGSDIVKIEKVMEKVLDRLMEIFRK